jgi:thioesterase domain-containing protein
MRYLISILVLVPILAMAETTGFELLRSEVISTPQGQVTETEWRNTDASGQAIGLHRYHSTGAAAIATLLYLPGTNMNGVLKIANSDHNLWLYLAEKGVEVYAMDYRTRFIPHDFSGDLVMMRDWSMDLFVEDAVMAVNKVREEQSQENQTQEKQTQEKQTIVPLYIAGFSRGASLAYGLAGQVEAAGLVALDGSFKRQPYEPFDIGAALQRYDEEARYASALSRRGYDARTEMMRRVVSDPASSAMNDRYQTSGNQLADTLYKAWGPGALANTRSNITPIDILASEMLGYDWFYPTIQNIEGRSIASQEDDPNTYIDDHFGEMTIPVLYFGSGGFGAESLLSGIHSAARSGSDDVTIKVLEDYGHLDVLFASDAPVEVYGVIYEWILRLQAPGSEAE